MTLSKALENFDSRRANDLDVNIKTGWLSELDMKINAELLVPRGIGRDFEGYSSRTAGETQLSAPAEYEEIYFLYLVMKNDFLNAEFTRCNNSTAVFNRLYSEMADFINRKHKVENPAYIKAGGLYE